MPGITNEHDLTPLLQHTPVEPFAAGLEGVLAGAPLNPPASTRLGRVRQTLDGVSGLGWSVIGFVLGAAFWHFVGFWGFMTQVVLSGGTAALPSPSPSLHAGERTSWVRVAEAAVPASAACTTLVLDRQTGLTSAQACSGDEPPLPMDTANGRQDRLVPALAEAD